MISLQFSTCRDPFSEVIRNFDRGLWSHVDAIMPSGNLFGARYDGGVQLRAPDYVPFSHTMQVDLPATDEATTAFTAFLYQQAGKPYDTAAVMAGFALRRDWRNDDKWFCSELVTAALEASGAIRKLATTADRVTPNGLYVVLSALVDLPGEYVV